MANNKYSVLSNWQYKIMCLVLAVFIYFTVLFSYEQRRKITVPLNVILPQNITATSIVPDTVTVVVRGSEDVIYVIDPAYISAVADFSEVDSEGIARIPVEVNTEQLEKYIDLSDITFYSDPLFIKIYFE